MENNEKRRISKLSLVLVLLLISVGFAFLSATLGIMGNSKILGSTFSVHWDDTSIEESGVTPTRGAVVTDTDKKIIEFSTELALPGDYYEFTVDAVNDGKINSKIASIKKEVYNSANEKIDTPSDMIYNLTYSDNTQPNIGDSLNKDESKKYKVRVGINPNAKTVPETDQVYTFKIEVNYEQEHD